MRAPVSACRALRSAASRSAPGRSNLACSRKDLASSKRRTSRIFVGLKRRRCCMTRSFPQRKAGAQAAFSSPINTTGRCGDITEPCGACPVPAKSRFDRPPAEYTAGLKLAIRVRLAGDRRERHLREIHASQCRAVCMMPTGTATATSDFVRLRNWRRSQSGMASALRHHSPVSHFVGVRLACRVPAEHETVSAPKLNAVAPRQLLCPHDSMIIVSADERSAISDVSIFPD
jgi:hypothetical protein